MLLLILIILVILLRLFRHGIHYVRSNEKKGHLDGPWILDEDDMDGQSCFTTIHSIEHLIVLSISTCLGS